MRRSPRSVSSSASASDDDRPRLRRALPRPRQRLDAGPPSRPRIGSTSRTSSGRERLERDAPGARAGGGPRRARPPRLAHARPARSSSSSMTAGDDRRGSSGRPAASAVRDLGPEARVGPDSWEPAMVAAGATCSRSPMPSSTATPPTGSRSSARPDTTRPPLRADGLLPLQQRRDRRPPRAAARGVERVAIVDWDVHHGNGTEDDLLRRPIGPLRLAPPGRPLPGRRRRASSDRGAGRGGGVHRQRAAAGRQRRRRLRSTRSTAIVEPALARLRARPDLRSPPARTRRRRTRSGG